jgi:hypothetical protein
LYSIEYLICYQKIKESFSFVFSFAGHVCDYFTEASIPHTFRYIMGPLSMPFKLDFKARTFAGLRIALAERNATESMFAEISK